MAYGIVNVPGVSGPELEAVMTLAQSANADALSALDTAQKAAASAGDAKADAAIAKQTAENAVAIMGEQAENFTDLGALAYRDNIGRDDLDAAVRASLSKADTALQSFTETDPTVPAWAKEATKPTYTAAEVGAIPADQADTFVKKSDLSGVYKYKGSVATLADLPAADNEVGDVWNVEATDMNYGWTGTAWDLLGQIFEIQALSNEEIDIIMGV